MLGVVVWFIHIWWIPGSWFGWYLIHGLVGIWFMVWLIAGSWSGGYLVLFCYLHSTKYVKQTNKQTLSSFHQCIKISKLVIGPRISLNWPSRNTSCKFTMILSKECNLWHFITWRIVTLFLSRADTSSFGSNVVSSETATSLAPAERAKKISTMLGSKVKGEALKTTSDGRTSNTFLEKRNKHCGKCAY